jgi:FKBP-type peptidyl-prolyl cis-trans isomerase FkpA
MMHSLRPIAFLILVLFAFSCGSPDGDFKKHASGLAYRFFETHPEGKSAATGDIMVLSIRITNKEGKVYDQSGFYRLQLGNPMFKGDFYTGLALLQEGDSACFRLDASAFFEKTRKRDLPVEFKAGDPVYIYLRFKNVLSADDLESEKENTYHTDFEQEMNLLKNYIELTNTTVKPSKSGIYYIEKKKGNGKKAERGSTVTVHYTGTTIDGKIFDSSLQRGKPITFILGQGQVIPGWDEGLQLMQAGGKARLIIPSNQAYGKDGFKDLILPYSTLVFEIELIDVK